MKSIVKFTYIILLLPLLLSACVREVWPENGRNADEWVIPFGAAPSPDIIVSTKGTLGVIQESMVRDMYVFIFDQTGHKIFSHLYDESNKGENSGSANWWECDTETDGTTSGFVHVKAPKEDGCKIVAICNLDAEMINLSPEYLNTVKEYDDLTDL